MFPLLIVSGLIGCVVGAIEGKANGKRIFKESLSNVNKKELISWEMEGKSAVIKRQTSNPQSQSNLNNEFIELLNSAKHL